MMADPGQGPGRPGTWAGRKPGGPDVRGAGTGTRTESQKKTVWHRRERRETHGPDRTGKRLCGQYSEKNR